MSITAEMVRALREKTGLPMMDCKKALTESGGDEAGAIDWLRKQGKAREMKMSDRMAGEGRIACHLDRAALRGGIVELRCETAPVANTDDFAGLALLIARVASQQANPTDESIRGAKHPDHPERSIQDEFDTVFNRLREKIEIARCASAQGSLGAYVHHNAQVGVLVEFSGGAPVNIQTDLAMHIAAMKPRCARRDEVPAEEIERERAAAMETVKDKPAAVVDKIVSGKIDRWLSEFVLLEQPFVKDDKQSVGAALSAAAPGVTVNRFIRYEVGGL